MSGESLNYNKGTPVDSMDKLLVSIPNALTYLRLGLIPVFVLLMIDPSPRMLHCAIAVFILAAVTDYVDGYLARRLGAVSDLGKLLDPLADKILVMAALVMLVAQRSDVSADPWVPAWMVVLVLAREMWVTGIRGVAAARGLILAAGSSGKWKSALQMVAIVLLLLHDASFPFMGYRISCEFLGVNCLFVSLFLSYSAALDYTFLVLSQEQPSVE